MPAPQELSQQIPTPWAKGRMQKPHGGTKFWHKSSGLHKGGGGKGWLWMKLIPA